MLQKAREWLKLQKEFGEEFIFVKEISLLSPLALVSSEHSSPASSKISSQKKALITSLPQENCISQNTTIMASSLSELKEKILSFEGCPLKAMATHTVFGDGNPKSPIMFIGEAPGAEEDKQGLPFVGQSGQLLNKMLESINLKRQDIYITNVVNWRPPGNRPPTPEEIEICLPFLKKHIELISPKIIVLLGATAMKAVLKINSSLSRARGIWHSYTPSIPMQPINTMVTFHPSYLLRSPGQKALAWQDFMTLQDALNND